MRGNDASRTAMVAALMRAVHARRGRPRLLDDPWGDRLVPEAEKEALYARALAAAGPESSRRLSALGSVRTALDVVLSRHPTYPGVILRSRYAEDALERAVERGVRHYVLLGAGLDSFALRRPSYARDLTLVEIDHPASQSWKLQRLRECGIEPPGDVRFVAADLAREKLGDVFVRAGVSPEHAAFVAWFGVSIYLTREANQATLGALARATAPGSELVFNYIDQAALDSSSAASVSAPAGLARLRAELAGRGEPWVSGFVPSSLGDELEPLGLTLLEDLDGTALAARYGWGDAGSPAPSSVGHLAHARVIRA